MVEYYFVKNGPKTFILVYFKLKIIQRHCHAAM